jgi:hypothetical protein
MLNRISDYFYEKPGRLTILGKTIALVGAGLLVAATGEMSRLAPSMYFLHSLDSHTPTKPWLISIQRFRCGGFQNPDGGCSLRLC